MTRRPSNPLALAVLSVLGQRPMHPYEMASTLRDQHKDETIKLNYGSLYTVVDALQRDGLIEVVETVREGRRPARTVYRLTREGRVELDSWLRDLLREPVKEYPQFAAGLSLMMGLPPAEALALLRERAATLAEQVAESDERLREQRAEGLPRLVLIESEYEQALREAELEWVRRVVRDIVDGRLDGLAMWHELHASNGGDPAAEDEDERSDTVS